MPVMDPMTAAMCAIVFPAAAWGGSIEPPADPVPTTSPPATRAPETPPATPADVSPIPFPHPLITEILYAVPNAAESDANLDGTRSVAGDEFVELTNPHDKPIQLFGYTLTDRNPEKKGQFKFTFPAFELPPKGVVVVFNGCESTWTGVGTVGDEKAASARPNESFHNAYVFTARTANSRTSFANAGDFVLLADPNGRPVQCVSWGTFKEKVPAATLVETAPVTNKGSVQRETLAGPFAPHKTEGDPAVPFSPGKFAAPIARTATPTPPSPPKRKE
jgi:hypothetical protein